MRNLACAIIYGIFKTIETVAKFLFVLLPSIYVLYVYMTHHIFEAIVELTLIYFLYAIFLYRKYIIKDSRYPEHTKIFQFLLFNIIFNFIVFSILLEVSGSREPMNDWIGFILVAEMSVTAIKQKGRNNLSPWEGEAFYQSFTNTILNTWLVYLAYQCFVLRENGLYFIIPIFMGIMVAQTIYKKY